VRILVITHKLLRQTKTGIQTTGGFPVQIDALEPYFERITLCTPIVDDPDFVGAPLRSSRVSVWPLPVYRSKWGFALHLSRYVSLIRAALRQSDVVLCITPGYVGILGSWLAQRSRVPMFQYVVTDWAHRFRVRTGSRVRQVLSVFVAPLLDWVMTRLTRDALTFFNGNILYGRSPGLHFTRVSSSLTRDSFFERQDTCSRPPYRLLFVGRLAGEKGLPYLLRAVTLLLRRGVPVSLDIVGQGPARQELEGLIETLDLGDTVHLHGFVPRGVQLDRFYRAADLFVLPSLEDMQPKVLLEAMANCLPVVASRVGGIPTHVHHEQTGLLFAPRNVEEMCGSIQRVIEDPALRRRLIQGGMAYARSHTVEAETERTMRIVVSHFNLEGLLDGTAS
jgi:glycosyltransferase involved in cell wall biosynthesis